jgi:hypothetical protein
MEPVALVVGVWLYDKVVSSPGFIRKHTPVDEVPVGRFMVPKFKFTFEFEASHDIQKLGVNRAFQSGDFSGMVSGGNGLIISGVYHKATVEVDEAGTVAAAATAEFMSFMCAIIDPILTVDVNQDTDKQAVPQNHTDDRQPTTACLRLVGGSIARP